ncbi:hypothetical protein [Moritella sp. F3]|uniref:hypothetical protein n=1 Tax=Moritella sp. F3 TaxID=2718882 RepID=UPI0018E11BE2|nr:hypothetical protein [Moritella sp. F3]GIC77181.1 hypothetical protein FMO001_19080 [Moritella sp. F1]GIC82300.1 hypothetical protein FMO003_25810 [Moritella sp. F3]
MSSNFRSYLSSPLDAVLEIIGVSESTPDVLIFSIVEQIALLAIVNDDDEMVIACQTKIDALNL